MKKYTIYEVETGAIQRGRISFTFDGFQIFNTLKFCEAKKQNKDNRFIVPVVFKHNDSIIEEAPENAICINGYLENGNWVSEIVVLTDEQKIKLEQLATEYFKKSISFTAADLVRQIL